MTHSFKRTELGIYTTVSEQLKQARLRTGKSLKECADTLHIQEKYLLALENSQYHLLPGEMYARSWIKKYAGHLGLHLNDIMVSYEKESGVRTTMETKGSLRSPQNPLHILSKITLRHLMLAGITLGILGYAAFIINESSSPPDVIFDPPLQDFRTHENSIILKGQTEEGSIVTINKQPVTLDDANRFSQEIGLYDGINAIQIEAKKKHSRSMIRDITIIKTPLPMLSPTSTATTTGPN